MINLRGSSFQEWQSKVVGVSTRIRIIEYLVYLLRVGCTILAEMDFKPNPGSR